MRNLVEFELLSPFMSGGIRIADNFMESESFIRGSVLRAAFAGEILLECPLADMPSKEGLLNYIELKDENGQCLNCENRGICQKFSDMSFSFAYPENSFPAPFTARVCKVEGTKHSIQDTIVQNGRLQCSDCESGLKRMESLKGFITKSAVRFDIYDKISIEKTLSTHTAINYDTHTAEDSKLYSVKAIPKGKIFTAEIDDCDTGMLYEGKIIYAGKYSSAGFGKMRIKSIKKAPEITDETVSDNINKFQTSLGSSASGKATILFLSDARLDIPSATDGMSDEEYINIWQKALFGTLDCPIQTEKVFAETQLYSGYDTSRKWNCWRQNDPDFLILKGTSVLVNIVSGREAEAIQLLTELSNNGIGIKTKDGFGQIAVCHEIHRLGVKSDE